MLRAQNARGLLHDSPATHVDDRCNGTDIREDDVARLSELGLWSDALKLKTVDVPRSHKTIATHLIRSDHHSPDRRMR